MKLFPEVFISKHIKGAEPREWKLHPKVVEQIWRRFGLCRRETQRCHEAHCTDLSKVPSLHISSDCSDVTSGEPTIGDPNQEVTSVLEAIYTMLYQLKIEKFICVICFDRSFTQKCKL